MVVIEDEHVRTKVFPDHANTTEGDSKVVEGVSVGVQSSPVDLVVVSETGHSSRSRRRGCPACTA